MRLAHSITELRVKKETARNDRRKRYIDEVERTRKLLQDKMDQAAAMTKQSSNMTPSVKVTRYERQ